MASDPSIQRRVSRLENETESIYEVIDDFRSETRGRFDRVETTLTDVQATLTASGARFDRVETTLTDVQATLTASSGRFDRVETTLTDVQATLTDIVRRLPEPG